MTAQAQMHQAAAADAARYELSSGTYYRRILKALVKLSASSDAVCVCFKRLRNRRDIFRSEYFSFFFSRALSRYAMMRSVARGVSDIGSASRRS